MKLSDTILDFQEPKVLEIALRFAKWSKAKTTVSIELYFQNKEAFRRHVAQQAARNVGHTAADAIIEAGHGTWHVAPAM